MVGHPALKLINQVKGLCPKVFIMQETTVTHPHDVEEDEDTRLCDKCGCVVDDYDEVYLSHIDEIWCEDCARRHATRCDKCEEWFSDSKSPLSSVGDEEWCEDCLSKYSYDYCECCGDMWPEGYGELRECQTGRRSIEWRCEACIPTSNENCENCGCSCDLEYDICPSCGECIGGTIAVDPSCFHHLYNYHDKRRPPLHRPAAQDLCIGFEFELEGDWGAMGKCLLEEGITPMQIHPEKDCSVDVEWVTQPIPRSEIPEFLQKVCRAFTKAGAIAYDSEMSCGCHHNVDREYLNDLQWDIVGRVVHYQFPQLVKFSGPNRKLTYCEPYKGSSHSRKAVHLKCDKVVELRSPGMTINSDSLQLQTKIYLNILDNVKEGRIPRFEECDLTFLQCCGPFTEEEMVLLSKKGITGGEKGVTTDTLYDLLPEYLDAKEVTESWAEAQGSEHLASELLLYKIQLDRTQTKTTHP